MRNALLVVVVALLALGGCSAPQPRAFVVTVAPEGDYRPDSPDSMLEDLKSELPPLERTEGMANIHRTDRLWVVVQSRSELDVIRSTVRTSPRWELLEVERVPVARLKEYFEAKGAE